MNQINIEFNDGRKDFFEYITKAAMLYDADACQWYLEIELESNGKHLQFEIDIISSFLVI